MKIKSVEYQNFRNFNKRGKIYFDTKGKISIVYGTNGDGKTTLHQLLQWILYEKVNFNKTTTNKLYNLEAGDKLSRGNGLFVYGQIEYEHEGKNYLVRRQWYYEKNANDKIIHKQEKDDFFVQVENYEGQPVKLDNPRLVIESTIPSGLSPYFFFDGETMIADLKMRGTESAKNLKKALYTIFDLELLEAAIVDIGSKTKAHSVLGELNSRMLREKENSTSDSEKKKNIVMMKRLAVQIDEETNKMESIEKRLSEYNYEIKEISESIGQHKSKKMLEKNRDSLKKANEDVKDSIKDQQKLFGKEVAEKCSYLLISEVAKDAENRLYLEVQTEKTRMIPGLTKELLINLLKSTECVCGNCIGDKEKKLLLEMKSYFPPASYKATYDRYKRYSARYSTTYEIDRLQRYLEKIVELKAKVRERQREIDDIDEQIKENGEYDELIDRRSFIEKEIPTLDRQIQECNANIQYAKKQLNLREKQEDRINRANDASDKYNEKIDFMEAVLQGIKERINDETKEYVNKLRDEICFLLENMLTSKREVFLSDEFQLQVKDSFGDESKSEGQFAVVSFAYIVGILKVLKEHEKLKNKEYPLVLDGPFSKLDPEQKKNVLKTIPKYVPQIIIFTKDSLYDVLDEDMIGNEYTIQSNDEKNNATIEEGFLWN